MDAPIEEAAEVIRDWLKPGDASTSQNHVSLFRAPNGKLVCGVSGHDKQGRRTSTIAELDELADLTCQMAATVLTWQEEHENCVLS